MYSQRSRVDDRGTSDWYKQHDRSDNARRATRRLVREDDDFSEGESHKRDFRDDREYEARDREGHRERSRSHTREMRSSQPSYSRSKEHNQSDDRYRKSSKWEDEYSGESGEVRNSESSHSRSRDRHQSDDRYWSKKWVEEDERDDYSDDARKGERKEMRSREPSRDNYNDRQHWRPSRWEEEWSHGREQYPSENRNYGRENPGADRHEYEQKERPVRGRHDRRQDDEDYDHSYSQLRDTHVRKRDHEESHRDRGVRTEPQTNGTGAPLDRDPHSHIRNWDQDENEGSGGKLTAIGRVLVSGAGLTSLEKKRADLKAECEDLENKLEAQLARQSRNDPNEVYVWVLVEYDNFGCERYLNGYANLPPEWRVLLFRNKNATGRMPPVQGANVVYSLLGGSCKSGAQKKGKSNAKKDDKSSLTYPGTDICMTVGDIAMRAHERKITKQTTIYFVCTPVSDPPRYFQQMIMLKGMGIQSSTFDGAGSIDDIFDREGLSTELYKTSHHHRTPKLRQPSKPPAPRTASRGRV